MITVENRKCPVEMITYGNALKSEDIYKIFEFTMKYTKLFNEIAEDNNFEYDNVHVIRAQQEIVVERGAHRCIIKYKGPMTKEKFKNLIESHLEDLDTLLTMGNI